MNVHENFNFFDLILVYFLQMRYRSFIRFVNSMFSEFEVNLRYIKGSKLGKKNCQGYFQI